MIPCLGSQSAAGPVRSVARQLASAPEWGMPVHGSALYLLRTRSHAGYPALRLLNTFDVYTVYLLNVEPYDELAGRGGGGIAGFQPAVRRLPGGARNGWCTHNVSFAAVALYCVDSSVACSVILYSLDEQRDSHRYWYTGYRNCRDGIGHCPT